MDIYQFLSALLVLVIQGSPLWGQDTCDQCDCKLSANDDKRAIYNVRTRCNAGSIEWMEAYGAIRLEVHPFVPASEDFRLCFVVESLHTMTRVSQEFPPPSPASSTSSSTPASSSAAPSKKRRHKFRQGLNDEEEEEALKHHLQQQKQQSGSLSPLVTVMGLEDTGKPGKSSEVCVIGGRTRPPVVLFVEVERTNLFTGIPSVTLQYDVETLPDAVLDDPLDECQPCTKQEVLDAYCTSDFVAVGKIRNTAPDDSSDQTQIEVAIAQLIHQNHPVFQRVKRDDPYLFGVVHVPGKCGAHAGDGDFLLTGRMRLGKAKLHCAPFYKDWLKMSDMAECVYN